MRLGGLIAAALVVGGAALPAHAAAAAPTSMAPAPPSASASAAAPPIAKVVHAPGSTTMTLKYGPMDIRPGQNLISVDLLKERPKVDGWITAFRPGMVRVSDGKSPPVTTVHLHHAVWLVDWYPTFATGEEKTWVESPAGFGWRYTTRQSWVINHMIHNLTPNAEKVYLTMELDFIPDAAPEAKDITEVKTRWMDVQGLKPYPVFDIARSSAKGGRTVYPDDFPGAYVKAPRVRNRWVVDRDATLVGTIGHVHPGGLQTDLWLKRGDKKVNLFRSSAHYFDPRGPISWDMGMTVTTSGWRVAVKKGDELSITATYETRRGAWYESMGIMPVAITNGPAGGVDPFSQPVDKTEVLSHGRLPENIDPPAVRNPGLSDPLKLRDGPYVDRITIKNYAFGQGDLSASGMAGRPASVKRGRSLQFVNRDPELSVFHTVTGCRAPCNKVAGIGFPLADGAPFDSGQLGYGPSVNLKTIVPTTDDEVVPITAAVNRKTWRTPASLKRGTYTYFCRVHPFMRGAFRVK